MRKLKHCVIVGAACLAMLGGGSAMAQQASVPAVTAVEGVQGYFDISPTEWSAEALAVIKSLANGEHAYFQRLFINEEKQIVRVEVADIGLRAADIESRLKSEASKSTSTH